MESSEFLGVVLFIVGRCFRGVGGLSGDSSFVFTVLG